jgi:hypothetical protein
VGNVKIRAKGKMTIQGLAPWANSDWYVRRVNHQVTTGAGADKKGESAGTYRTRFTVTR